MFWRLSNLAKLSLRVQLFALVSLSCLFGWGISPLTYSQTLHTSRTRVRRLLQSAQLFSPSWSFKLLRLKYLLVFIFLITVGVVYVSASSAMLLAALISSMLGMFYIQGLGVGDIDAGCM